MAKIEAIPQRKLLAMGKQAPQGKQGSIPALKKGGRK